MVISVDLTAMLKSNARPYLQEIDRAAFTSRPHKSLRGRKQPQDYRMIAQIQTERAATVPPLVMTDGPPHAVVDLRAAGRIQRRVWRAFMTNPDQELTTADLARWCYPRLEGEPARKHRCANRARCSACRNASAPRSAWRSCFQGLW